ncbi:membrane protein [Moritella viscosa]|nr:membrane protein [Moritella viscosa]
MGIILISLFVVHYFSLRRIHSNSSIKKTLISVVFLCYILYVYIVNDYYQSTMILMVTVIMDVFIVIMIKLNFSYVIKNRYYIFYGLIYSPFLGLISPFLKYLDVQ